MGNVQDMMDDFLTKPKHLDNRESLNQNLQPDILKIDSVITKISKKKATRNELLRLNSACERLKATIDMQLKQGG